MLIILLSCSCSVAKIQDIPTSKVVNQFEQFSNTICSSIKENSDMSYEEIFHSSFREAVTLEKLLSVLNEIYKEFGPCTSALINSSDSTNGVFFTKHKNTYLKFTMNLEKEEGKFKIFGLVYNGKVLEPVIINKWIDLDTIANSQEGTFSILFKEMNGDNIYSFQDNERHALGSVFKLYILATILEKTKSKNLSWNKKYRIKDKLKSLPSGDMQNLKEGTSVKLIDFAKKMISISDNTAADHLLNIVTKDSVENLLTQYSLNSFAEDNSPFLSTLEMFKTRAYFSDLDVDKFIRSTREIRQQMVDQTPFKNRDELQKKLEGRNRPFIIKNVEWFATPKDICSLYNWMDNQNDLNFRKIISMNTPIVDIKSSNRWRFAGYKGGSELGVLEMSYLLEDKSGKKYCLYVGQNNEKQAIDEDNFFAIVEEIFKFLELYH